MTEIIIYIAAKCTHASGCDATQHAWSFSIYTGTVTVDVSGPTFTWAVGSELVPVSGSWDLDEVSWKIQFAEAGFKNCAYTVTALPQVDTQHYYRCLYNKASTFDPAAGTTYTQEVFFENAIKAQVNNYAKYM